ncbi:hypothetical protein ACIBEJ_45920 [Nonomuraea sp. NPDC050790]|uniref:hypothetical protein n=1 Tax=Nonomuraea sp. NPDC050790 TaxID=3364371 RepID=UPI0037BB9AA6
MPRVLLAFVLLLTGCAVSEPTLTQTQAIGLIDKLINQTVRAITPKPRLEVLPSFNAPSGCAGEGASEEQIIVSRAYWLRDVPKDQNLAVSRQVRLFWQSQGHRIVAAGGGGNLNLSGESRPEGFKLSLTWAEGDHLYLGASSTCIWPDGTPAPGPKLPDQDRGY